MRSAEVRNSKADAACGCGADECRPQGRADRDVGSQRLGSRQDRARGRPEQERRFRSPRKDRAGSAWARTRRVSAHAGVMSSTPKTEAEWDLWMASHGHPPTRGVGRPATSGRPPSVVPLDTGSALGTVCLVDGCDARVYARLRCRKHYRRWMHENRTYDQREFDRKDRNAGNITKKNAICIGCGKLGYGNSRTVPKAGHLCLECRRKRNLVHCDFCGREYQRRRRADQPGLHNYCSTECHQADRRRAAS